MRYLLSVLLISFFSCNYITAQVKKNNSRDSLTLYKNIENYSKKRKGINFVHKLLFRPTEKKTKADRFTGKKDNAKKYANFEGKIIRKIIIETFDPFGYSLEDSVKKPKKWAENTGNFLHIKSKKWTIRNALLFKKNTALDSLLLKESERLIQQRRFVRNVEITPKTINGSNDSVDVYISVLDSWSLIPSGSISSSKGVTEITERNFLGLGHEFENNIKQRFSDSKSAYGLRYTIPNFKNTFINTTVIYDVDYDDNYYKGIGINRTFFSPFTRWAGGISFEQRFYRDSLTNPNSEKNIFNFKNEIFDTWAGHSVRIFKGKSEEDRILNFVTTLRYLRKNQLEKPTEDFDPYHFYNSSKIYLTSLGITSRKFIKTKYLFNNGINEYVQIGKNYSITGGMEEKNSQKRGYFAGRFSFGGFYKWGYFSTDFEAGSFFLQGNSEQTVFKLETIYFTDIIEVGNWKFRQFAQSYFLLGNNRIPIKDDLLTLDGNNGIQGFTDKILGTKKFVFALQTQSYVPGNLYGFRMSPFFNASFGFLADESSKLLSSKLYSKFGLGVLISNDYMIFNSFQISLAYYPSIPGSGKNQFRSNTFKNNDLQLMDFQIGKPYVIPYE